MALKKKAVWILMCYIAHSEHRKRMTFLKISKVTVSSQDAFFIYGNSPRVK